MPVIAKTLAEVAAVAGVSRMTVSRVLRHPEKVADATRERVQLVIRELGYRPNPLISTLMASTRHRRPDASAVGIAFLTSLTHQEVREYEVARRIYEGAERRALGKGYDVLLYSLEEERMPLERFGKIMRARGIEGIIFGPLSAEHVRLPFDVTGFAAAACGFGVENPVVHRVATNQWELASKTYLLAVERGYRRIGVALEGGTLNGVGRYWNSAFLLHQHLRKTPLTILHGANDQRRFLNWFRRLKPDCVIGSAPFHYEWLQEIGVKLPRDCGFLLLGNHRGYEHLSGWLKNYEAIGAAVVDLIALQFHDNERTLPDDRKTVLIDPHWNEGTTISVPSGEG